MNTRQPQNQWDIFCTVIDNHGDLGVCWRLARQLADAGQSVRLWVDDARALAWMAPHNWQAQWPHIRVLSWAQASDTDLLDSLPPAQVWIEAFGCPLPNAFVAHAAANRPRQPVWINLEYLSAESWVPRMHGLPSPVMSGPAKGWRKTFFYPGFTPDTGGLLREADVPDRQRSFDRAAWRTQHSPKPHAPTPHAPSHNPPIAPGGLLISLFCYEPDALPTLLAQLVGTPHHLLAAPGRPLAAVQQAVACMAKPPSWSALPYTHQNGFDEMLWACDLNFVRGEDSLVRALWAGQPFIWHIYPQDDNAHHAKLEAFLDWMQAPESLRQAHRAWNAVATDAWPVITAAMLRSWQKTSQSRRNQLLSQPHLLAELMEFIDLSMGQNPCDFRCVKHPST